MPSIRTIVKVPGFERSAACSYDVRECASRKSKKAEGKAVIVRLEHSPQYSQLFSEALVVRGGWAAKLVDVLVCAASMLRSLQHMSADLGVNRSSGNYFRGQIL